MSGHLTIDYFLQKYKLRLKLVGYLDLYNENYYYRLGRQAIEDMLARPILKTCTIDARKVEYIDSTGLGWLLWLHKHLPTHSKLILLDNEKIRPALGLTSVDRSIEKTPLGMPLPPPHAQPKVQFERSKLAIDTTVGEGYTQLDLTGRLDIFTADSLIAIVKDLLNSNPGKPLHLVINLAATDWVDSSGLGVLIESFKKCRQTEGNVYLAAVGPKMLRTLEITGLTRVLNIYETTEEAIRSIIKF